jgi:Uma2 family endonuclease
MSTIVPTQSMPMTLPPPGDMYRFTTDQYDRMVREGTIAGEEPVELLDGIVVRKMSEGPRHDASFARCRRQLERLLEAGWYHRLEGSVRIPDYNEPEPDPDLCVVRGDSDDFTDHHPGPDDVALIVEVAESSLARDRGEKRDNYARTGIPVYWIVDLVNRRLEVYANPAGGSYPAPTILGETESTGDWPSVRPAHGRRPRRRPVRP